MKILHTSDWHLGKDLNEFSLIEDQFYIIDQIVLELKSQSYDVLVIAGDIFDRSIASEDAIKIWNKFLFEAKSAHPNLNIIVIAGNHDSAERLGMNRKLLELNRIYIKVDEEMINEPIVLKSKAGEVAEFYSLPFLPYGTFDSKTQNECVDKALEQMSSSKKRNPENLQILVSHLFVRGGKTSDSERTLIGGSTEIDESKFIGFDCILLGHLHRPQEPSKKTFYSGSILQYSTSELNDKKVLISLELSKGKEIKKKEIALNPKRIIKRIKGKLDDLIEKADTEYKEFKNCYIIAKITSENEVNVIERLRNKYPFVFRVEFNQKTSLDISKMTISGDSVSPESAYNDFYQTIHDGKVPDSKEIKLFSDYLSKAEKEAGVR